MANKVKEKMKLTSIDELLGVPATNEKGTEEIDISLIQPFKNHPFKVLDDEKMDDLVDSVIKQGIISPVIVRPLGNGTYEMISGHRRMHAAKRAHLTKIPAIVLELTDDESTIIMVDANLQREEVLPSERAFSFKMKMDAMRHQGALVIVLTLAGLLLRVIIKLESVVAGVAVLLLAICTILALVNKMWLQRD